MITFYRMLIPVLKDKNVRSFKKFFISVVCSFNWLFSHICCPYTSYSVIFVTLKNN